MHQFTCENEGETVYEGGIVKDELVFIRTVSLVADPCQLPSNLDPEWRQP